VNDNELIKKQLKKIEHRGPDNSKIKVTSNYSMGFARLSIHGLTVQGDQPLEKKW
jgi:asparagine synthetase B (glutamine-hydrolysing)